MNIYEINVGSWYARVKAATFRAAIRKGLDSLERDIKADSDSRTSLIVRATVIARNVARDGPIPSFEDRP